MDDGDEYAAVVNPPKAREKPKTGIDPQCVVGVNSPLLGSND
jgi:hypothetical protein